MLIILLYMREYQWEPLGKSSQPSIATRADCKTKRGREGTESSAKVLFILVTYHGLGNSDVFLFTAAVTIPLTMVKTVMTMRTMIKVITESSAEELLQQLAMRRQSPRPRDEPCGLTQHLLN